MTESVLDILKLVLLGLLYLFFARVLWAVWSEVRPTKVRRGEPIPAQARRVQGTPTSDSPTGALTVPAERPGMAGAAHPTPAGRGRRDRKPHKGRRGRAARLVVIEPRDRRGTAYAISGELTIGRDDTCTISLAGDTYASSVHARVYDLDGQPMVEDLGSTNGSFHNGNKLVGSRLLHPGDRIQIGFTVLEAQ